MHYGEDAVDKDSYSGEGGLECFTVNIALQDAATLIISLSFRQD